MGQQMLFLTNCLGAETSCLTEVFLVFLLSKHCVLRERESANRSQIDIKSKTYDIETRKKHLFLDISSTNMDTLVPSLYQCVENLTIAQVFRLLSQSLPLLRFNLFVTSETFATYVVFWQTKQMKVTWG
jgi:hypothetical protein